MSHHLTGAKNPAPYLLFGFGLFHFAAIACRPCEDIHYHEYIYERIQTDEKSLRAVAAFYQLNTEVPNPKAIVVGDAGTIITRSRDGIWSDQESGTSEDLFAVSPRLSTDTILVVGAHGTILRSSDLGASWAPMPSGTDRDLFGISTNDALNLVSVAVGDGVVLQSFDDGESWQPADLPGDIGVLRAVNSLQDQFLAVGDDGVAIVTNDGGLLWTMAQTGITDDILSIGRIDVGQDVPNFTITGQDGTVLQMKDDAGLVWALVDFNSEKTIVASRTGEWAANQSGAIYEYVTPVAYYPPDEPHASREWIAIDGSFEAWAISSNAILHIEIVRDLCPERGG